MQVLLWEDMPTLGKRGEIVKVKDGYARNFLFPRKLATMPTVSNKKDQALHKRRADKREERVKDDYRVVADKIQQVSLTLEVNANEEGVLFGSVTSQMIADALAKEGITIDSRMVQPESPIKELGPYQVPVVLHADVKAMCPIWVVEARETKAEKAEKSE